MAATDTTKKQVDFLFRHGLQLFAVILIVGILLRIFIFSSYAVSGWAMLPSVWPGDFIVGRKAPWFQIQRGDVVTLRCPGLRDQTCIKRVVGLPGDRVEWKEGTLWINERSASHQELTADLATESQLGENWLIWPDQNARESSNPVVVPPQHFLLLNDKRSDRDDSRSWGPVAADLIEAKLDLTWLSLDWYDGEDVRSWPEVRWSRFLRRID